MEMLALTCPQCGSANVKLLPERNDLAQCNYCSSLFMLAPPGTEEVKPTITAVQEEEEEEEVDMTEVVYPIKPTPPSFPLVQLVLAGGLTMVGLTRGINAINQWKPDPQQIATWGILFLIGISGLLMVFKYQDKRQKEYRNSEEMQTYIKEGKAAFDKSIAQIRQRRRQKK